MNDQLARACLRATRAGHRYHQQVGRAIDSLESGAFPPEGHNLDHLYEEWKRASHEALALEATQPRRWWSRFTEWLLSREGGAA